MSSVCWKTSRAWRRRSASSWPNSWRPPWPGPDGRRVERMCKTMTKPQWVTTRKARFPRLVRTLAEAAYAGEACVAVLHDALIDARHEELAAHFADPKEEHAGRRSGPGS